MYKVSYAVIFCLLLSYAAIAKAETWIMYEGTFGEGPQLVSMSGNFQETFPSGQTCLSKQLEGITNDPERMNSSGSNFTVLKSLVNGEVNLDNFADAFILNGTRGTLEYPAFRACIRVK